MKTILCQAIAAFLISGVLLGALLSIEMNQPHVARSQKLMIKGLPSIVEICDAHGTQLALGSPEADKILNGRYEPVIVP